jgi:hypothetical protein
MAVRLALVGVVLKTLPLEDRADREEPDLLAEMVD